MIAPKTGRAFTFLVNPTAGGGAAPGAVVPVARALREAGATVDVTYSPGPQAMARLVDEAVDRGDVVVSVGGDGMLSSLAGLVAGRDATLAVVPAGRGNDFARMLGFPHDPDGQARVLLESDVRRIDLLSVSGLGEPRMVAGSVYAGVDARAAEIVDGATWLPRCAAVPVRRAARARHLPAGPLPGLGRRRGAGVRGRDGRRRELGVLRQGHADRPARLGRGRACSTWS